MDNGANPRLVDSFPGWLVSSPETLKRDLNGMVSTQNSTPVQVLTCRPRDAFNKLPPSPILQIILRSFVQID
jgi:hypothetical protein